MIGPVASHRVFEHDRVCILRKRYVSNRQYDWTSTYRNTFHHRQRRAKVIGGESSAVKPSGPDSKRQFLPRRLSSFDLGPKGDQGITLLAPI